MHLVTAVPKHSAQAALQATQTVVSTSAAPLSSVAETSLVLPAVQVPPQVAPVPAVKAVVENLPTAHLVQPVAEAGARHSAQVASQAEQVWSAAGAVADPAVAAAAVPAALPIPAAHLAHDLSVLR